MDDTVSMLGRLLAAEAGEDCEPNTPNKKTEQKQRPTFGDKNRQKHSNQQKTVGRFGRLFEFVFFDHTSIRY